MPDPLKPLLAVLLTAVLLPALAAPSVEVRGLMRDRAVLVIDGTRHLLRVGETSPEGVTLVAADAREARVRIEGKVLALGLSRRLGANFEEPETRSVSVARDVRGQFRVAGTIEGRPVRFLVDTGASIIAMSGNDASALGIDYRGGGRQGSVVTAAGRARSHFVTLDRVEVGGLRVHNVDAAVVEGAYPEDILLGMSFLRHVGFAESAGVLTLTQSGQER
jgi:aspartyl protease family protein